MFIRAARNMTHEPRTRQACGMATARPLFNHLGDRNMRSHLGRVGPGTNRTNRGKGIHTLGVYKTLNGSAW